MKPKIIAFDLDDTLLDTTSLLIPIAKTPAFFERIKQPLPLMPGALENLEYLSKKYTLVIVTMGHVPSQQQKVSSLNIKHFFTNFYFADPAKRENKKDIFSKLGDSFLSIGNRRSMDIREAKLAGGLTCLFKYGEHQNESIEVPEDRPDFEVENHNQLIKVCQL